VDSEQRQGTMSSLTLSVDDARDRHGPVTGPLPTASAIHRLALALVWLAFASSAIVFTEPAPVDVLMLGVVILLPTVGLVRLTPPLLLFGAIWMTVVVLKFLAGIDAIEPNKVLVHSSVTLFLVIGSFVIAGFVMRRPGGHVTLIYNAYAWAALFAAMAGIIGYFKLVPGAAELFTRYARASGTFKDPNVFGPFLVAPLLYLLHLMLNARLARLPLLGAGAALLAGAILLSFSRGAWLNLFIAVAVFAMLSLVTARTNWQRLKIIGAGLGAALVVALLVIAALQSDGIGQFLAQRAQLTHSYDEGPEGRFGGQLKALRLILEHPFGLGAQQFSPHFHFEEPHNVYLAMYLNAGWIGGSIFLAMIVMTIVYGFGHALRPTRTQALFLIAYAATVANAVEGLIIDLDHWRHVHLLIAILWGLMLGDRDTSNPAAVAVPAPNPAPILLASRPPRQLARAERIVGPAMHGPVMQGDVTSVSPGSSPIARRERKQARAGRAARDWLKSYAARQTTHPTRKVA
jgi:O-antigen ligase